MFFGLLKRIGNLTEEKDRAMGFELVTKCLPSCQVKIDKKPGALTPDMTRLIFPDKFLLT
jgi:hypothetical protein